MAKSTLESERRAFIRRYHEEHPTQSFYQAQSNALRSWQGKAGKAAVPARLQPAYEKKYGFTTKHKRTYEALRKEIGTTKARVQMKELDTTIRSFERAKKGLAAGEEEVPLRVYYEGKLINTDAGSYQEARDKYWDSYYEWFNRNFGVPLEDYPVHPSP
jgi:hypothetical protein